MADADGIRQRELSAKDGAQTMHTLRVIAGGVVLLVVFIAVGRYMFEALTPAKPALWFIPIWLLVSVVNLWVGVSTAGYTVMQEAPILAIVFGVPAAIAGIVWWAYAGR